MILALDFETALTEPGLQVPPPVCLSVAGAVEGLPGLPGAVPHQCPGGTGYVLGVDDALDLIEGALDAGVLLANLEISYDLAVAVEARPRLLPKIISAYDEDRITDIGVRQKLIDIAMGLKHQRYSLAALSGRLLNRHLEKEDTWRLRYWDLAHLPVAEYPADAIEYAANDAVTALEIYRVQEQELTEIDRMCVLADQYRRSRGAFILKLTAAWGLRTDAEGCRILRDSCEKGKAEREPSLLEAGYLALKMKGRGKAKTVVGVTKKKKPVQEALLSDAHKRAQAGEDPWKLLKLTPKGLEIQYDGEDWRQVKYLSTDAEACGDADDPLLMAYSEYAQLDNLLGGFVKAAEAGTVTPIHTRFEILLTTGRTSSSGPNVQAVSKQEGARECFVPRPGWVFIGCDIDRAELHTLSQVCINLFGYSTLADSLNAGIDPHTKFGARLAHCSYEELKARLAAGDDAAADLRQRAKPANFGFPGGMGPNGMRRYAKSMYKILLSREEADSLYDGWCEEYPEISGRYLPWIKAQLSHSDTCTIEHFGSGRWRGGCTYCVAANSFFQGMAADAMIAMLWALGKKCLLPGTPLYGCRIVNEVHDEILIEAPLAQASDAAYAMQSTMIEAYNTYTTDVPVNATPVVMDRWSKKAKPIVEDGVYKVWRYRRPEVTL